LTSRSFACIRFAIVTHRSQNRARLVFPHKCAKPKKSNVSGFPGLVECAWAAVRSEGYLQSLYRRRARRFGGFRSRQAKNKAIIAVAHKLIVIIWHVLATGSPYQELGADYFTTRIDPEKETRHLVAKLQAPATPSPSNPPPNSTPRHPQKSEVGARLDLGCFRNTRDPQSTKALVADTSAHITAHKYPVSLQRLTSPRFPKSI